jgi:hypothetical protein
LDHDRIVDIFGKPHPGLKFGVVALTPSFARSEAWQDKGSLIADNETIEAVVNALSREEYEKTAVLANRYDGIDLPDDACRILIFDSLPYSESLIDLYGEQVRPGSEATLMRTVRSVEQGIGRSVRGEKDYSVIVVTAPTSYGSSAKRGRAISCHRWSRDRSRSGSTSLSSLAKMSSMAKNPAKPSLR